MRLTKQSTYAVRVLMYCASNSRSLATVSEVAKSFGMSEAFLFKLIKPLVSQGILQTVRGRSGGIRLSRPPEDISLYEVIRATEDNFALAECMGAEGTNCPLVDDCGFNHALFEALGAFFDVLRKRSIRDITENRAHLQARLGISFDPVTLKAG